jgi:hypothetical protein
MTNTRGLAELHADHPWTKIESHTEGTHFGLWCGRALPQHGMSRQHLNYLVATNGGEVFSEETHNELKIGQRCRFRLQMDKLGISAVAVGVEPVEPTVVIEDEPIEQAEVNEDKSVASSPSKRNRSK